MANVSSNNLTTLYSGGGVNVRPTSAYGNANVVSLLNAGTDGGNTVTNIVAAGNMTIENITANGNVTADYFIGNFVGNATNANYANYAGEAFDVNVANVTGIGNIAVINLDGNVSNVLHGNGYWGPESGNLNANYANFAGQVVDATQSNITSLGTLTGLTSNGTVNFTNASNVTLGSVGNLHISGGTANYVLQTDGAGNLSWSPGGTQSAIANGTSNVSIATSNGNVAVSVNGVSNTVVFASDALYVNKPIYTPNNVTIGNVVGNTSNPNNGTVAIGYNAGVGSNSSAGATIAIGANVGNIIQRYNAVVIGANAGHNQGIEAIAIGAGAGQTQDSGAIAIGKQAGATTQGENSIAIGKQAGNLTQGTFGIAIGGVAGQSSQGNFSVAIGYAAGQTSQANNSIILNASGSALDQTTANSFTVKPVRLATSANILYYDNTTGEITYEAAISPSNVANANYSNFAGTLINGTSNVSIPTANGSIAFSANNVANLVLIENGGLINAYPTSSAVNMLRINTFGNPLSDAHRVAWARARGSNTSPTSVNPNDNLGVLSFFGHNGTSYQTNSVGFVRARVDASYTANGANIPIGMQVLVNDTNGGVNNQTKTHNFYANGNVNFANSLVVTDNITATNGVFTGNGSGLSQLAGANVTGEVANANYATYAGTSAVANSVAVANVVGIGNIATINLDGNVSNALLGDGSWGPVEVTSNIISNGTSNVSIPVANGNIQVSVNGNANIATFDTAGTGTLTINPLISQNNGLRINTVGRGSASSGASRLSWFKSRGTLASPLSVQPSDYVVEVLGVGHNGTSAQTNSVALIRAQVDSSYTANGANIPLGWQVVVNDTNGGVNNQSKTHNFYSNGYTSLAGGLSVNGGSVLVINNGGASPANVTVSGDGTTSSSFYLSNVGFSVNWSNVDTSSGFSPFRFDQITSLSSQVGVIRNFRARGTSFSNIAPIIANDEIYSQNFGVYGDSGNTYLSVGGVYLTANDNDGAGNVPTTLTIQSGSPLGIDYSNIILDSGNIVISGNASIGPSNATIYANGFISTVDSVSAANVSVQSNGFMKLASYTATALNAITGQIGWMAAVSDSASGGNPNGMLAFWDTTNSRWSYVHDNSAV